MKYQVEGYISGRRVSTEYKVNYLARMLAGYDDETWGKLTTTRKQTYKRAASVLLHDQGPIFSQIKEWSTK